MKIKFKATPNQYGELVKVIGALPYNQMCVSNIELINLKHFYFDGMRKLQDYHFKATQMNKVKSFTIDVNHYEAIKSALNECGNVVTEYVKSIFYTVKQYAEPQILQAVSAHKFIG